MSPMADLCRKRRRRPRVYGLHWFMAPGCVIDFGGAFRDNVRVFLSECAEVEEYGVEGMPTWVTFLADEKSGLVLPLYTVEEPVHLSPRPFCDYCRCTGWSHHFVSKRRYHLIIPAESDWDRLLDGSVLDPQGHLLHGLIHCNGFGHLVSVNGREGGSKHFRGQELLDLFDRICTTLRVREITVEDASKKKWTELRLLYGVAYGQSWFGRWGYKLRHGCFGITESKYQKAVEILGSISLDNLIRDFRQVGRDRAIKRIIATYQKSSETGISTLGDLLRCMLNLKAKLPFQQEDVRTPVPLPPPLPPLLQSPPPMQQMAGRTKASGLKYFSDVAANLDSRWPKRRMELAAEVIVEALKEAQAEGRHGMTRQDVREVARAHIGDTGLLDFVLKSLGGCVVGDNLIRRTVNPSTRVLEFSIREVSSPQPNSDKALVPATPAVVEAAASLQVTGVRSEEVDRDIWYVYKHALEDYPVAEDLLQLAAQVVLDCKHFSKVWPFKDNDDEMLRFFCGVVPDAVEMEELTRGVPASELVVVPPYATVGDLRLAGEHALRDTYCVMEEFEARAVEGVATSPSALACWGEGVGSEEEEQLLFGAVESGSRVWLVGSGIDTTAELKYEGGADNWTVDCSCGAKDDDGERMVACDVCEVWQHTRCGGIDDADAVPQLFLCERCAAVLVAPTSRPEYLLNDAFLLPALF